MAGEESRLAWVLQIAHTATRGNIFTMSCRERSGSGLLRLGKRRLMWNSSDLKFTKAEVFAARSIRECSSHVMCPTVQPVIRGNEDDGLIPKIFFCLVIIDALSNLITLSGIYTVIQVAVVRIASWGVNSRPI